jgi:hypothetical protein
MQGDVKASSLFFLVAFFNTADQKMLPKNLAAAEE